MVTKKQKATVEIDKLRNWDINPRTITPQAFERLKEQIKELGEYKPLLVTEDNEVIGGNMRLRAYKELGYKECWVSVVSPKSEEEKLKYALSDNDQVGITQGDELAQMISQYEGIDLTNYTVYLKEPMPISQFLDQFREEEWNEGEQIKDIKDIKILNLYSGIGGNRKLWGELKVTTVEYNKEIADIYKDYFPNDEVIISDAHKYLEENFDKFDFIWTSPPCPTHSLLRKGLSIAVGAKPKFPDMKLYEEILFLQGYFKGKFVVENVKSWYDPLIEPQERGRHYYWTNFDIPLSNIFNITEVGSPEDFNYSESSEKYGFNLDKYKISSDYPKDKILRNMVHPEVGKYILECAYKEKI